MFRVAVDARMIRHSGIGVVLSGLLQEWAASPPPFEIILCGSRDVLQESIPSDLKAEIVNWTPKVYSLKAAIVPPRFPRKVHAWYSPHYATCLRTGLPVICHIQDVLHITHPTQRGTGIYNRLYLIGLRQKAKYVLTTSRHVKVQLQTLYYFRPDRVLCTRLGPGIIQEDMEITHPLPPVIKDKKYLLSVGIFKPHKNWDFLFWRLSRMTEIDMPLVCAGTGKERERVHRLAEQYGISDRIITLPRISDESMAALYKNADGLIFPSVAEGFGLPILEALKVGTPVLIANRSPMKEIAWKCAFTFDPDYPESFDRSLNKLINDDQQREENIRRGIKHAASFTWKRTALHLEDALVRAVKGSLPPPRRELILPKA